MKWHGRAWAGLVLTALFLPFVAVGGEPEPFSLDIDVRLVSEHIQFPIEEPFAEVAVYSVANPGEPLFRGFTDKEGALNLGLFAGLPQSLYVEVKRDRADGLLQRALPLVRCDDEMLQPRGEMNCSVYYDYESTTGRCECYHWPPAGGEHQEGTP
jgi:hypothetical protein